MAWRSSGKTNKELVENLYRNNMIKSLRVKECMESIDRANYTTTRPYDDSPQSIGFDVTISAPHMHASALQMMLPYLNKGAKVLDVGCGSGYLTACFADMVGEEGGKVVGIDRLQGLVELSRRNIQNDHPEFLSNNTIELVCGDGREGYEKEAPYNCIHVGAAAFPLPPKLIEQLSSPGVLFLPYGPENGDQVLLKIEKDENGEISQQELFGVRYVPLK